MLERYAEIEELIDRELVRLVPRRRDSEGKVRAALAFNAALGDPQRAYPAIQIAGTSGKGTVSTLIATSLQAAGLRTGLHVSPYLQVLNEKTWLLGRYASVDALHAALPRLRPVAERFAQDDDCPASVHGMASLALSYLVFEAANLDAVVMETGLGGRFDLVQGLRRELCVITDLALDHLHCLGPTLQDIAWHKAGILERDVPCVAVRGAGWDVLQAEARACGAPLLPIVPRDDLASHLDLPCLGRVELDLPLQAPFHLRNVQVAAAALDALASAGWPIRAEHLREGFRQRQPGRFEVVQDDPRVVLDGAHNPHKLTALLEALGPCPDLIVVLGATGSKAPLDLLRPLQELRPRILTTQVELYGKAVVPAAELADAARSLGLEAQPILDPQAALEAALAEARPVLVTGSIYLVGRARERWYPSPEILRQGTSWPVVSVDAASGGP